MGGAAVAAKSRHPALAPGRGFGHARAISQTREAAMDYSKSGNPKSARDSHHAQDLPRHGAPKAKAAETARKEALLARMKAAAEARKKG